MAMIRLRFIHGIFEPLERVNYSDGQEVIAIIEEKAGKQEAVPQHQKFDEEWITLSLPAFAKDWDNDKDAIYDNWQEKYPV